MNCLLECLLTSNSMWSLNRKCELILAETPVCKQFVLFFFLGGGGSGPQLWSYNNMCNTHSSRVFMHPVALGAGGSSGVCFRSAACMSWDQASETEISIKPWFYNRCYFTINTTNLSLSQLVTILYFLVPRHSHFPFSKRHPFCGQNHLLTSISFKEHSLLTLHTTLEKSSTRTHTHTPVPRVGVFISHKVHMYWKPSGPFVWQPSGGSSHLTYGTRVLQCHLVGVLTLQTVHTCFSATWWEYSPYTQYRRASVPPAQLFSGRDSAPSSSSPSSPHFSAATGSSAVHEPYLWRTSLFILDDGDTWTRQRLNKVFMTNRQHHDHHDRP